MFRTALRKMLTDFPRTRTGLGAGLYIDQILTNLHSYLLL